MKILHYIALVSVVAIATSALGQVSVSCPSLPCTITVNGPVVPPPPPPPPPSTVSISPTSLTFSAALNTDSAIQTVTLTNPTASDVALVSAISGAGFAWGNIGTCKNVVPAKDSCTLSARYHPTSATPAAGQFTVTLAGKVTTVPFTGTVAVQHGAFLQWTAPSGPVTGYSVYRATTAGGPYGINTSMMVSGTSYLDPSIAPQTTYYYVVQAVNAKGNSSNSNEVKVVVP